MERIPILEFNEILVVSLQGDIYDTVANQFQEEMGNRLSKSSAKGVLIDISALDMVDTYIGRVLGMVSEVSKIMGAKTVVVGMQPAVAITLVELGMELKNIQTAINMNLGMKLLQDEINSEAAQEDIDLDEDPSHGGNLSGN